jgi:hypothetical protein
MQAAFETGVEYQPRVLHTILKPAQGRARTIQFAPQAELKLFATDLVDRNKTCLERVRTVENYSPLCRYDK